MSREIPNLEIVLAREDLRVSTVWGEGSEIRIAAAETAIREKVRTEIDAIDENLDLDDYVELQKIEKKKESERERRRFEGYAWYRVAGDQIAGAAAQPAGVEFIPLRDGVSVPVEVDQWKARAPGFEIRTADDGLYKVVGGRTTKLLSGNYEYPVVSPDGRWAIVTRSDEDRGKRPVRVDLVTRQEYPIEAEEYGNWQAATYLPSLGRFLIERFAYYDHYDELEEEDAPHDEISEVNLKLVDLATGKLMPVTGELRPLAQQTFRPLQKAARPGELWAALPDSDKNETLVGTLNTRNFAFKQVIRVPKIMFDSMQMWVDEPRKKLYFVYRGHLLSLPMPI